MRATELFALLLPAAVSASPLLNPKVLDALFCKVNNIVINVLDKDAAATAYCSSFLSIPTSTISKTATVTPPSVYTTISDTVYATTVSSQQAEENELYPITETATTTEVKTEYSTTTLTTSTATISCLNSAYTQTAPVGVVPNAEGKEVQKRSVDLLKKPAAIPNDWTPQRISKACSCLSILTASTTTTLTSTLPAATLTTYTTEILTAYKPYIKTNIITVTDTETQTTSATTTQTVTAYATATTIASNGVQYRAYTHPFDANSANSGFSSSFFKAGGKTPNWSGTLTSLSFSTQNWPSNSLLKLQDRPSAFASDQYAILMQGFFIARESGEYRFIASEATIDNWGYMWIGDVAYSAWGDGNAAFKARRTGEGAYVTGETRLSFQKGDAVPVTYLWANGGGAGQNILQIVAPSGQVTTNHEGYFVQACGGGVFA